MKKHCKMRQRASRNRFAAKSAAARTDRLRLSVFRSNSHIYAQIIDDEEGVTLVSSSTVDKALKESIKKTATVDAAAIVGTELAKRAKDKGISRVYFDRGSFKYTGKIKALADAARAAGLDF